MVLFIENGNFMEIKDYKYFCDNILPKTDFFVDCNKLTKEQIDFKKQSIPLIKTAIFFNYKKGE